MSITGTELTAWLASLLWPFMRIGAMFAAAPILAARSVPIRVRILLAFMVALVLFVVHTGIHN